MTTPERPLRLAVIGLGRQGMEHVAAILDRPRDVELVALCDADPTALAAGASTVRNAPTPRLHSTLEGVSADPDVEALVVALPHDLHAATIELAHRHRKHVLKEKPLALSLAQAHAMAGMMHRAGLVLQTCVQRRHHPLYLRLKELLAGLAVRSAALEMAVRVGAAPAKNDWRRDPSRAGGGVLIDLGYHGIDLLEFLMGPLRVVSCLTSRDGRPCSRTAMEDTASVWAVAGTQWLHMHFVRAADRNERLVLETQDGDYVVTQRRRLARVSRAGVEETLFTADESWKVALGQQLEAFARAVRTGSNMSDDLAEQTPTLRFIEQCYAARFPEGIGPDALEATQ